MSNKSPEPGELGFNGFPISLFYLTPIDTDGIQDPNVLIALKNLPKKNAITREKRLAEFQRMLADSLFDVTDYSILTCWLQTYPRLAVDSLKTVRLLVHQIQQLYMEKYGAKEFTKYLKSSLPIWLQGLYDEKSISGVVREQLLASFQRNESTVDSKLWVVFHEQIINYCYAVLVHESASTLTDERSEAPEDAAMKYERAMNASLMMLLKLIRMCNCSELLMSDSALRQANEILTLDKVWDYLGVCLSGETFNSTLFRTFLALVKELFSLSDSQPLPFTSGLGDVKAVYKTVSKKFIKHVKTLSSEKMPSEIIYSSTVLPLMEALISLTAFSSITQIGLKQVTLKKNFWQIGGSKSFSRFKDYVKLGPCNSNAAYYALLQRLFELIAATEIKTESDFEFLDFSSSKHAKVMVSKSILPQFQRIKGPGSIDYRLTGIDCFSFILSKFCDTSKDDLSPIVETVFLTTLDLVASARTLSAEVSAKIAVLSKLSSFIKKFHLNTTELSEELLALVTEDGPLVYKEMKLTANAQKICKQFYLVLQGYSSETATHFVELVLERTDSYEEIQDVKKGLNLISDLLTSPVAVPTIASWAEGALASYVSDEQATDVLKIFESLVSKDINLNFVELMEDMFTKISIECPDRLTDFLLIGCKHNLFAEKSIKDAIPEAYTHLLALTHKAGRLKREDELVFAFLEDEEIFRSLLETSNDKHGQLRLMELLTKADSTVKLASLPEKVVESLVFGALANIKDKESQDFLRLAENASFYDAIFLKSVLMKSNQDSFTELARFLSTRPNSNILVLFEREITQSLDAVNLNQISIANSLGLNVFLTRQPYSCAMHESVLVLGSFLRVFVEFLPDPISIALLGYCHEYAQDYLFLADAGSDGDHETGLTMEDALRDTISSREVNFVADLINGESSDEVFNLLLLKLKGGAPFSAEQYYASRVVISICRPALDGLSLAEFEELSLSEVMLFKNPLLLATFLTLANKFIGIAKKLDRLRNHVFSEILGVKSSNQIMDSGKTILALATNFVDVDFQYTLMPGHKLALVINQFHAWLESEAAFEEAFTTIRTLLAGFLAKFIQICGDEVPEKTLSLASELCSDNLATVQTDQSQVALHYYSMKLFDVLERTATREKLSDWKQSRASILESVIECLLPQTSGDSTVQNLATHITFDLAEKILFNAKGKVGQNSESPERLYALFSSSSVINLQRIATHLLLQQISETQQDVILEYQMSKSGVGNDSFEPTQARLPAALLQIIESHESHVEDDMIANDFSSVFKYLWSWVLIFQFFEDSTYSMKADYIKQLKDKNCINRLLDSIFDTLPLTEMQFFNTLVLEPVEKNSKVSPENCLVQTYNITRKTEGTLGQKEALHLLSHLYYSCCHFIGSLTRQWYTEVRDLQLKQQVQKFSVRYVSPILISKMLQEVDQAKDKLTAKDENLTIKVNQVTNEIKSVYAIDEQIMEMVVSIPELYPLADVAVEGPLRLGVKENQWKAWLLASQRVVSLTNGSIIDCIELFNRNVNLHFSGFEECAICYSILHQDHSLPSKVCPTCTNKFHAACLYKWFKSSGSSTCPLCRSTFNFKPARA